jgi:hypothetical protein
MIETYKDSQTWAIIELLDDFGYDSIWRTHNMFPSGEGTQHDEYPPDLPYWSRSRNASMSLQDAAKIDLDPFSNGGYKDYLFGFEDQEKCLHRLLD